MRALLVAALLFGALTAQAAPPNQLQLQGRLANLANIAVDGDFILSFSIFATESGGEPVWTEIQFEVTVLNGVFSTRLGLVEPLPAGLFADHDALWLEVKVGNDPPLPRSPMSPSLAALSALSAETLACTGCVTPEMTSFLAGCKDGQVLKLTGGAWGCGDDEGTIYTGQDFAVSGLLCGAGQVMRGVQNDGSPNCVDDKDTTYDGTTFGLSGLTCSAGQIMKGVNADGTPACGAIQLGDFTGACDASTLGTLRFKDNKVEVCLAEGFAPIAASTCSAGSKTFDFTGQIQSFTVPLGCFAVTVKAWGGGGGAGGPSNGGHSSGIGGGAGFVKGNLTVVPGQTLDVSVGGGGGGGTQGGGSGAAGGFGGGGKGGAADGAGSNGGSGGGAGGRSSVTVAGATGVIAGGGGGGGAGGLSSNGGSGGNGCTGNGAGGTGKGQAANQNGTAASLTGGGGGGGGGSGSSAGQGGGGGGQGGSCAGGATTPGSGVNPGNSGDPDNAGQVGVGGAAVSSGTGGAGKAGRVVISWGDK